MIDRAALLAEDTGRSVEALESLLAGRTVDPVDGPVRFVGLGSSRFASMIVATILAGQGRAARVEIASAVPAPALPGETCFVVSASGRTAEVVGSAGRLRGVGGPVIAVTNDAGSPLAHAADAVIELHAGREASGIATLTYRATIAALARATGATTTIAIDGAIGGVADALAESRWTDGLARTLDGAEAIDVVAPFGLAGCAEQVALMLREGPRLRAVAWDAAEWLHTAIYTALPGHRVLTVGGSASAGVRAIVEGRDGVVGDLRATPPGDAMASALTLSVAGEQLAAALWARTAGMQVKGP